VSLFSFLLLISRLFKVLKLMVIIFVILLFIIISKSTLLFLLPIFIIHITLIQSKTNKQNNNKYKQIEAKPMSTLIVAQLPLFPDLIKRSGSKIVILTIYCMSEVRIPILNQKVLNNIIIIWSARELVSIMFSFTDKELCQPSCTFNDFWGMWGIIFIMLPKRLFGMVLDQVYRVDQVFKRSNKLNPIGITP